MIFDPAYLEDDPGNELLWDNYCDELYGDVYEDDDQDASDQGKDHNIFDYKEDPASCNASSQSDLDYPDKTEQDENDYSSSDSVFEY